MSRPVNSQDLGTMASAARSSSPMAPMDTSSPRAKVEKTGVLYSPFGTQDMVTMAMGENFVRLAKGKLPYDIILPKEEHAAFNKNLGQMAAQKQRGRSKEEDLELDSLSHLQKSLSGPERLGRLDPAHSKLYVMGHGDSGSDTLSATVRANSRTVDAQKLSSQLSGLHPQYMDVRALSCNSADPASSGAVPFAQHLANVMGATHPDLTVTGYRGEHMMAPDVHHHEQGNLDGKGVNQHQTSRRSTVSAAFTPLKLK